MKIWVIARLTILEAVRRRIVITCIILGALLIIVHAVGFSFLRQQVETFSSGSENLPFYKNELFNFTLMAGFYAINFLCIMMAAIVSANSLSGEITNGTILTTTSKPLNRIQIVTGKWLGLAILVSGYTLFMLGSMLFSTWLQTGYLPPNPFAGIGLIVFETLIMMTVSLAFSSRLSTLATGAAIIGLFGIAFIGSWIEQISSYINNQQAIYVGIISSLIMPSEAVWRRASYEMTSPLMQFFAGGPFVSNSVPSVYMLIYAAIYMIAVFFITCRLFENRDL